MPDANPELKKEPEPELFADGPCDRSMPVREVVESFDFGQFVDLVLVPDNGDRTPN